MSERSQPAALVVLDVDRIVPGGKGLARDDAGVVFVEGALPGEQVRARITGKRGGTRHADVVEVLTPSGERVTPDCGLHPRCGGCDMLHASTTMQVTAKAAMVKDGLVRTAKLPAAVVDAAVQPVRAPTTREQGGRRRARFVVDGDGALAYAARRSHDRVPVQHCPALHPVLDAALARLHQVHHPVGGELQLAMDDRGHVAAAVDNRAWAEALVREGLVHGAVYDRGVVGDAVLLGEISAGRFLARSDAGVFTQATRFGAAAIIDEVLAGAGGADLRDRGVCELFCGAGHITLPLLAAGARVHALEGAPRSIAYLRENAALFMLDGKLRADVAAIGADTAIETCAVLIADPPRTGIPGFSALLSRAQAERLVLVSCDIATGARDIAAAVAAGYALQRLVPIDAFPRTSHVEWVATLTR